MNVVGVVHDDDFADVVLGSAVPVVVGFCDAERSAACAPLLSVLDELAADTAGPGVVRVDVTTAPRTSAAYGISVVPSIVVFSGGSMLLALPGAPSRETVLHMLQAATTDRSPAPGPV